MALPLADAKKCDKAIRDFTRAQASAERKESRLLDMAFLDRHNEKWAEVVLDSCSPEGE